jgi:hypothetical protein
VRQFLDLVNLLVTLQFASIAKLVEGRENRASAHHRESGQEAIRVASECILECICYRGGKITITEGFRRPFNLIAARKKLNPPGSIFANAVTKKHRHIAGITMQRYTCLLGTVDPHLCEIGYAANSHMGQYSAVRAFNTGRGAVTMKSIIGVQVYAHSILFWRKIIKKST